jgi:hypothetical protein
MISSNAVALKRTPESSQASPASYFGLAVEVIQRMENYSLIRYQDCWLVVDTQDLQIRLEVKEAAL